MSENETPLLERSFYYDNCPGCRLDRRKRLNRGIPVRDFLFVCIITVCTSLPISSLYPFLYFMIRDLHVAERTQDIGFYAGFVGSAFMLGRCLTSVFWGMAADRYGRKPIILLGAISVIIFNGLFGLSTSYWMTLTTRFFLGFCNGMLGPVKLISIPLLATYSFFNDLSGTALKLVVNAASIMKNVLAVTVITGFFILQNNAVDQCQRGAANGINLTAMSLFKSVAPACGGAIFSWSEKRQNASFLPGDMMVFFLLNLVQLVVLMLSCKPFLTTREK